MISRNFSRFLRNFTIFFFFAEIDQKKRETNFVAKLNDAHEQSLKRLSDTHKEKIALLDRQFLQQKQQLLRAREGKNFDAKRDKKFFMSRIPTTNCMINLTPCSIGSNRSKITYFCRKTGKFIFSIPFSVFFHVFFLLFCSCHLGNGRTSTSRKAPIGQKTIKRLIFPSKTSDVGSPRKRTR